VPPLGEEKDRCPKCPDVILHKYQGDPKPPHIDPQEVYYTLQQQNLTPEKTYPFCWCRYKCPGIEDWIKIPNPNYVA
jgi:hypothetical protein